MTTERKPREWWLRVACEVVPRCIHPSRQAADECAFGCSGEEVVHVREVLEENGDGN
jgi:hypothetical protein